METLIGTLRDKLPAAEVDYAVEDALVEAGYAGALGWFGSGGVGAQQKGRECEVGCVSGSCGAQRR